MTSSATAPVMPDDGVTDIRAAAGRSLVWSIAERWGGQLLSVGVFTLLARVLDRPAFGAMALANIYIAFVQIFITQGIGVAIIQRRDLRASHLDTAFWMNVGAAVGIASITVALRAQIAELLGSANVAPVLGWLALTLPLSALSVVPSALLTREMKFRLLATRSLTAAAISGGVGVGAALLGFGVWSLVLQQLTAATASTALLWSTVSWRPGIGGNRRALADMAPFCASVVGNDLLWLASQRADQAVIGRGLGVETLGAYAIAVRLITLGLDSMTGPTQAIAMPLFSGIQNERERLGRVFLRSTALISAVACPAFLGLLLVGPRLIPLLLGSKWQAAIVPLQILCATGCLRALQTFVHPTMMALGRTAAYTALFALSAAVSVIGCWVAVQYGVAAIAWATVIAAAITATANFAVLSRLLQFPLVAGFRVLWPIVVASVCLAVAVILVGKGLPRHLHPAVIVAAQVAAGSLTYVLAIRGFAKPLWLEVRHAGRLFAGQRQSPGEVTR
jgi:O-antigen/teichoic acid export membrane protein